MGYIGTHNPASYVKGLWYFDGNSNDSSGNSNNGTDTNISYTQGKFGQCASFNGSNSHAAVGTDSSLQTQTFTLLAWVNTDTLSGNRTLLGNSAQAGGIQWRTANGGAQELLKQGIAGMGSSSTALSTGTWQFIGVSYSSPNVKFYLNGVPNGTASSSQTFSFSTFWIGERERTTIEAWDGLIDTFIFCNTVLTDDYIKQLYYEGKNYGKYN